MNNYDHGTIVHQEVGDILESINKYLSAFGDKKPESITLNPYEWAVMDLTLRQATGNNGSLHTYRFNELIVSCEADLCYCHHFLNDLEIRDIVKTINNYLEAMGDKAPESLSIDPISKQKLNARFDYFFNGAFNIDSKSDLALQIIRVTGQELYKTNYHLQ